MPARVPTLSGPRLAQSTSSFFRARSFRGLRGFSRVGGVLFGQESKGEPTARYVDLRWEADGPNIRLVLVDQAGKQIRSRLLRKSLVASALAYASDGRPLAVTMVTARPLDELKIMVHPTLIDSPMGLRLVELDRFVDTYARSDPAVREAEVIVLAHQVLYQLARRSRLQAVEPERLARISSLPETLVKQVIDEDAQPPRETGRSQALADMALKNPERLADVRVSPLKAKPEYFDPDLVRLMIDAARPGASRDDFSAGIREAAKSEFRAIEQDHKAALERFVEKLRDTDITDNHDPRIDTLLHDSEPGKAYLKTIGRAKRWLFPAPTFENWSGVREREFALAAAENFPAESGASAVLPIDFMLQVAFTSAPYFREPGPEGSERKEETNLSDEHPWEFPTVRQRIHSRVLERVAQDARSKTILADSAEFVVLQRFFAEFRGGGTCLIDTQ
jgi:hypothetical protein